MQVQEIVRLALEVIPQSLHPLSVIWHGGFARGESGFYSYRGRQLPFGDYDLEFICPAPMPAEVERRLEAGILERFGYRPVSAPAEETLEEHAETFNVLDLKFTTPTQLASRSVDLATYDLVHSSRILYGEDLRSHISIDIESVPLFSAYRILHNRLFHLLSLFHVDLWKPDVQLPHQLRVAYSLCICRMWLDFGMALSLCLGKYAPDYQTRLKNLEEEGKNLSVWFRDWKGLMEGIQVAMEFKKNPQPGKLNAKAIRHGCFIVLENWDKVTRVLLARLIPYYLGKGYELEKVDYWMEVAEIARKRLPRLYYREYLHRMLSSGKGQGEKLSGYRLEALAAGANLYENAGFRGWTFPIRHPKRCWMSPEIVYFATLPLLAFSITPLGKIHYGMLNTALHLVEPYRKMDVTVTGRGNWQEVKDACVDVFSEYRNKRNKIRQLPRWLKRK